MRTPARPLDEADRLERLRELFVLDSEPEPVFDSIALLASQVCGVPIALISLIDGERQWFKANVGLPGVNETPRDVAFCAHAILDDALFEVPDATADDRFVENPLVTGQPDIRFYAGAPLVLPGGERVGTLCVIDRAARRLDPRQASLLRSLAQVATQALLMRRDLVTKTLSVRTAYEQALAASSAELADLYDNAPCGYHSLDRDGRIVRCNATLREWLGCTQAEVDQGLRLFDFLTQDGQRVYRETFPKVLEHGSVEGFEFGLVSRTGVVRHLIANASIMRAPDGTPLMSRTVSLDITELRRARDELRRLAEEQDAILNTDLVGIVKVRDRRIVWSNAGAEKLFGHAPGGLLDRPTRELFADEASYLLATEAGDLHVKVGEVFRTQLEMTRKDGERRWIDLSATALASDPLAPLCMLLDITPLKRAELVRMRAQVLEAENRQLLEANRFKGMLLSNISHELRTPLNAVLGYAQLLLAGGAKPGSPQFARYVERIDASGKELLALIDTVLSFAQVESGKFEFAPVPARLKALIGDVVETQLEKAQARQIGLGVQVDEAVDAVVLDPLRLAQIVSIFVSNAIKFSHDGGSVRVRARPEGEFDFRIEVEDNGIGVAAADLPRLFTAFQQLSEGSTKHYGGAGLGLALARKLAQAQGGSTGVSSEPGAGSVFWVVLPRDAQRARPTVGVLNAARDPGTPR